jgi:hypothetical protein
MTRVHLVLSDDWELRGDGSRDVRVIQFGALRLLLDVYEAHGLRASINAEVMPARAQARFSEDWREATLAKSAQATVRLGRRRGRPLTRRVRWR